MSALARAKALALDVTGDRFRNGIHLSLYLLSVVLFLSVWHAKVTGRLSPGTLAVFALICGVSLVWGRLFTRLAPLSCAPGCGLTLQFLCGFLALNTLLFVLSLVSPLGIAGDLFVLAGCGVLLLVFVRGETASTLGGAHFIPDLLCVLISGAGATLWCTDLLSPVASDGSTTVFRAWQDIFGHARLISMFAQSHGPGTLSDLLMATNSPRIYHYAVYPLPGAVLSVTGAGAYEIFSSFLVPFGLFLTGLAAFSLAASIWGAWPALAATVAVILLPDAYQQGFGNRYLSYNFLQQVNPGGMYGVACASVAWIFILDGCRTGRYASLASGYAVTAAELVYKAHLFVANAFLAMIFPCLFLARLRAARRVMAAILLSALFVLVVALSQRLDGIPTLRLDGSATKSYLAILLNDYDPGVLKDFFNFVFVEQLYPRAVLMLLAAGLLLLSTFGLWTVAAITALVLLWKRTPAAILCFPILVVANYLVMAVGLAMDAHGIGTPDELLNRPLVWAYFVVVAWTGGAGYFLVFGSDPPRTRRARTCVAVLGCLSFAIPLVLSENLQTFPARKMGSFRDFASAPNCLVKASLYIRDHSDASDILQDSQDDPKLQVTGLAERQAFAIRVLFGGRRSSELLARLEELATFRKLTNAAEVKDFAARRHISWYLLRPGSGVAWPGSVLNDFVFDCEDYRVYRFAEGASQAR